MSDTLKPTNPASTCPECGAAADCELERGKSTCWCFELPAASGTPDFTPESRCLCRHCLEKQRRQSSSQAGDEPT